MSDEKTNGDVHKAIVNLTRVVTMLDVRTDGRMTNLAEQMSSVAREVKGIRQEQGNMGVRVAEISTMCAARGKHCGEIHDEIRRRQHKASDEVDALALSGERLSSRQEMTEGVLAELRETSQVHRLADLKRAADEAFRRKLWKIAEKNWWKVLVALGAVTGLGVVIREYVLK